jgi:hypothetical protein
MPIMPAPGWAKTTAVTAKSAEIAMSAPIQNTDFFIFISLYSIALAIFGIHDLRRMSMNDVHQKKEHSIKLITWKLRFSSPYQIESMKKDVFILSSRKSERSIRHFSFCLKITMDTFELMANLSTNNCRLRPPSVPLVACDPYFSIWSPWDHLTDGHTTHWTGAIQSITGLVRIDGNPYRFCGPDPVSCLAMKQEDIRVYPTRTLYTFSAADVRLDVCFFTPLLPENLDVMSRPVTYIRFSASSLDAKDHQVQLYLDCSASIAVNDPGQEVICSREDFGKISALKVGTVEQPVLGKTGDDLRIDWGYFYLSAEQPSKLAYGEDKLLRQMFLADGGIMQKNEECFPRAANDLSPVLAGCIDLGMVSENPSAATLLLAYDDILSLEYMGHQCSAWWRRDGKGISELLTEAWKDYPRLYGHCKTRDRRLQDELQSAGGYRYACLASLAYRQCISAHKLAADPDGNPIFMSKENFSNGCIDTVDVTYPSSPFFLYFNPTLLQAQIEPIMKYACSPEWKFPFAPHDLGTYPRANGQVYGGGADSEKDQMPVEECGNMLIMIAALAKWKKHAGLALKYWPLVTQWAEYLREKGLDPENQLCTDDFAGHLAHNANLSLKAIMGIGSYSLLCDMTGRKEEAKQWLEVARSMAQGWMEKANDGDHYRLAFDSPGSWSQKYNMVWDHILRLNLFPSMLFQKEWNTYLKKMNRYGLPLDNRSAYTKLDWMIWTASVGGDVRANLRKLMDSVFAWINETPSRVPLTDWYWTTDGRKEGFQARSVVGGVYIPLILNGRKFPF